MESQDFRQVDEPGHSRGLQPIFQASESQPRLDHKTKLLLIIAAFAVASYLIYLATNPEPIYSAFR